MKPFTVVEGTVAPLDRNDVDTDQIIPKQFLKRLERTGYGPMLFHDWRTLEDGSPNPDFILNREPWAWAPILLAGRNFGCGSSREHAAWALSGFGIRVVVAPSFADIFQANCFQNGILPVILAEETVGTLMKRATRPTGYRMQVDLERCTLTGEDGFVSPFEVVPYRRQALLEGLDEIGLTLQLEARIRSYEAREGAR